MFNFIQNNVQRILEKALTLTPVTKEELLFLLNLEENSFEVQMLRSVAREISKMRFGNSAMLLCQTGVEAFPCVADCNFCSFGKSQFMHDSWHITDGMINNLQKKMIGQGIYAHFLLFMHNSDFLSIVKAVKEAKQNLPFGTDLVINCGDLSKDKLQELKNLGVNGAYHVLRLGEGLDTCLNAKDRLETIKNIKEIGLDWYTCCEPIGPEHTSKQILEQIFYANEYECFQNAVMRRIMVTDESKKRGQISLLRSAQITAVLTIAMLANKKISSIAIHEPDLLGLTSGANCIYAEFGVNPRDNYLETSNNRGYSIEKCKAMLIDCGYKYLMQNTDIPILLTGKV